LEIIEAHFLFDVAYEDIEVLIHPQSVVHSMVEFVDGSLKAQLGVPDMHLPIALALNYPERIAGVTEAPDLAALGQLVFEPLDAGRYPALALAQAAGRGGGTIPAVLNAANEEAVALFLQGQIPFVEIVPAVQAAVDATPADGELSLDTIMAADRWARERVRHAASRPHQTRSKLLA
jgi:1-deoxy-D-xylulose-5-phosphate reductoisomerase